MTFTLVATDICFHWFGINIQFLTSYTRSRQEGFCRKADLRNLAKFKGKQLCQSLFFDKVPGLSTFLQNTSVRLPLHIVLISPLYFYVIINIILPFMFPAILYKRFHKLHKKWSFPLRISPVHVTKSAGNCVFYHIYWRNPQWKTSFFVQWHSNPSLITLHVNRPFILRPSLYINKDIFRTLSILYDGAFLENS